MKTLKNILMCAALGTVLAGCTDLDIPPKNILTNEDIYNEGGITAYMAGLYNHLPMEDFNMGDRADHGGFYNWLSEKTTLGSTGEYANNVCGNSCVYGDKGYWKEAYQIIREANVLIQDLPNYSNLTGYEEWIAEARFIRAYTYYALVKRYGGVPLLAEPQPMTSDQSVLNVARSSHEDCVDFILEDLDYAMQHMTADKVNGRANKYVAAAVKMRVALYAGSVARYGQAYNYTGQTGTMLTGIPEERANDYFQQAFAASLEVEKGGYALHTGSDKRQAFYEVFDNEHAVNFKEMLDRYHIFYEETEQRRGEEPALVIDDSDIPSEEVRAFYIKEAWYFDQNNSVFDVKTLAICPILFYNGDMGETRMPMFWLPYETIRPYINTTYIMTSNINNATTFTIDDYFRRRMFKGDIIKTQNLLNRPLQAYCPTPDSLESERQRIEKELAAFEKSIWIQPDTAQITGEEEKKEKQLSARSKNKNTGKEQKVKASKNSSATTTKSVRSIRRR